MSFRRATSSHDEHTRRLLAEIESGRQLSQRSLAHRLGIALGLTNLLLRRLVQKGWVRVIHIKRNRVRYLLTPAGIAEKARMSGAYFQRSVQFYAQARGRIRERFTTLSAEWPVASDGQAVRKRIMFFGTGEVAEIGYVCLQETDLELVGVVDTLGRTRFFGVRLYPVAALADVNQNGAAFDWLVVMSFGETEAIRSRLRELGFPLERVFWI